MPPAPLEGAGFLVAGLLARQYSDWLGGLLASVLAVWFSFFVNLSVAMCAISRLAGC